VAHPAISPDELTLYFVSDMDGSIKNVEGKNSKDIWKVNRESISSKWGEPVNLGEPINTPGDELFPYVHADGTLYFASDGHMGMGGLDIFKATPAPGGNWDIQNMKYPINSPEDDFGICFEADREAGFFSSSRKGKGDDIYMFLLPPLKFAITGVVKNEHTDEPIPAANIKSISSDGITLESTTGNDGTFKFLLKPATDYVFLAEKDGYLKGKERETTKGKETSTDFTTTIYLAPIDKVIRIENIFFDFASAELRPESTISLDKLVETLNDNPNIVIELGSHTDSRGNDDFNLDLSERRAQSVVNYLISKGINPERLVSKGYGETQPKVVDKRDHDAYPFLPEGQVLTDQYIYSIKDEDLQELAHFLNRRTEFKVLRTDFVQK
jgi:peptidoglycan-associated lipoprotein